MSSLMAARKTYIGFDWRFMTLEKIMFFVARQLPLQAGG